MSISGRTPDLDISGRTPDLDIYNERPHCSIHHSINYLSINTFIQLRIYSIFKYNQKLFIYTHIHNRSEI